MRLLFLSVFFIQFLFSDTIVTEFSSLLYSETSKIEDVDYLGITKNGSVAYRHYNSNKIMYLNLSEVVNVYDSEGKKILYKNVIFNPDEVKNSFTPMNALEERFNDLRNSSNGTAIALIGAGMCHLVKSSIKISTNYTDLNSIEDNSDKLKKIENLDKAEGLLILIAGITLLTNNDNNNISYYTNPLNDNSLLNLSIKF